MAGRMQWDFHHGLLDPAGVARMIDLSPRDLSRRAFTD